MVKAPPMATVPAAAGRRWFAAGRAAYGLALLSAPGLLAGLAGVPADHRARAVARVLGARQVAQAAATAAQPSTPVLRLGAGVDLAHALSMLVLAAADHRRRRAALTDAGVAAAFAAAGLLIAQPASGPRRL